MLLLVLSSIAILYSIFFSFVVLLRKIKCPEKSLKYCILNTALLPVRFLGVGPYKNGPLTQDSCIKVLSIYLDY